MFATLEDYLRVLHGQGIHRHTLAVQSCGAVVTVEIRPDPDSGLRIECGVAGCRCWPIAWEEDFGLPIAGSTGISDAGGPDHGAERYNRRLESMADAPTR